MERARVSAPDADRQGVGASSGLIRLNRFLLAH
jgi:hypothetical protein